jgi:hypothetical protein
MWLTDVSSIREGPGDRPTRFAGIEMSPPGVPGYFFSIPATTISDRPAGKPDKRMIGG